MAKKRVPGFGEGFQSTFVPTAQKALENDNEVMMANLRQILSQPEREQEAFYRSQALKLQQNADQRAAEENARQAEAAPLDLESKRANIAKTNALTKNIPLRLQAMKELAGMSPATQNYMEEILGLQPGSLAGAKRSEAFALSQTQKIPADVSKSVASLDSGIRQIDNMRSILNSPEGQKAKMKAGGSFSTLLSLGDSTAQKLKKSTMEATDIITRIRTGAALNKEELKSYGDQILSRWDTPEATNAALDIYSQMFKETKAMLASGRPVAPISKDELLGEINNRMAQKLGAVVPQSAKAIIEDGRSKGLSREQIKANLKAAGH